VAAKVKLRSDLDKLVARHDDVTKARVKVAERVSARAAARTEAGATRESHRVEVDRSQDPPLVACVAGEGDDAWPYIFQELGGTGWRPPPAPLRTAGKAEGNYQDRR
jgi:hypothetical protein